MERAESEVRPRVNPLSPGGELRPQKLFAFETILQQKNADEEIGCSNSLLRLLCHSLVLLKSYLAIPKAFYEP